MGLLLSTTLAHATPDFWRSAGWKTDFNKTSIDFNEILSGGPPRDGIPSIDDPKFIPIAEESDLGEFEPVLTLTINDDTRAYPLRILTWHEIVNDTVGGVPVAVTYCPLCNAAIAFERKIDGQAVEFGTSGMLRNSDLVMYDRKTESWWQQFTGEAIVGSETGSRLKMVPVRVEGFKAFAEANPQAQLLVPTNSSLRQYGRNPYTGYDSRAAPYPLYTGSMPNGISPMARVIVVRDDGDVRGVVSLNKVRKSGSADVNGAMVSWQKGVNSALDSSTISEGRDVGSISVTKVVDGEPINIVHDVTFAFVAHAFHPEVEIQQ